MPQVVYSEGSRGPEALVFEVIFQPGETPNILLEEKQPGNKVCALHRVAARAALLFVFFKYFFYRRADAHCTGLMKPIKINPIISYFEVL